MTNGRPGRLGAPIGLQLTGLLIAVLVIAHLVSFAVILLTPPPHPPMYRVDEVAAALEGGSLLARYGRPMVRSESAALPDEFAHGRDARPGAGALAVALGRPRGEVRLSTRAPFEVGRFGHPPDAHRMFGPPPDGRMRPSRGMRMGGEAPIFGDFIAAVRSPGGGWTVVRSSPEPFPTEWQKRGLMWLLASLAVVGLSAYLFARRITAPLKRFSQAAEQLGRNPQGPQMTLTGPAEIGVAAEAFNGMQARLKRYIDDRTAMVGAISHDLRTPLARIRFRVESAPGDLRAQVLSDVAQMEHMIGGVLAFIRNEGEPQRHEPLDLLSVVECVVDDAAMVGADVEIASGRPVMVDGDAAALQRLFVNLVENAVRYGAQARIDVGREGDNAVVVVSDRGEGLSAEDLERVFQPFYRTDASRNLDTGGIGLGLAIARSTARAHGGDITLSNGDTGLRATVTLPASG
ncbi:HAMP domain-containing sensor histidine kinase [Phenylobacterium sp.]|uniref:HAMP domain-containing sensor histidine kinase n=1 Tax=Phenylobacterium sp. TaxID=1871053 RepID=UPI0027359DD0|nr:HAMP domain-containing sensor histidine kinase [Phenylobacterium sp.]MDP3661067.1 HAMP domain-containing sensor histidine kinase [Phenylobacterium sp.]